MKSDTNYNGNWQLSNAKAFWGEISPCEHFCQIYDDDDDFLNLLENFITEGFDADNCVIVIATAAHLEALKKRLTRKGVDLDPFIQKDKYIPLDAEKTLAKFMQKNWPDEDRFMLFVRDLLQRAHQHHSKVRAFGEMVALLWAQGRSGATVQLEQLWNKFCETESFCLFCAYPRSGFTQNPQESIKNICRMHSKLVGGWKKSTQELFYKDL